MFTISTEEFVPKLQLLNKVIVAKSSMPILESIKIEVNREKQHMIATAFDGDTSMHLVCSVKDAQEDVSICVEAKTLLSTLSNLMGYDVVLEINKESHLINGRYGKGRFKIPFNDSDDYPETPSIKGDEENEHSLLVVANKFFNAISATKDFVADDMLRPMMCGVHFDFANKSMDCAATNGHQLVKYTVKDSHNYEGEEVLRLTIPTKPTNIIYSMLSKCEDSVHVIFSDALLVVKNHEFKVCTRLVEGKYPNYNSVIPTDNNNIIKVKKADIIDAIKHVVPLGNTSDEMMCIDVKENIMKVNVENIDYSTGAEECVECITHEGEDILIGFKSSMLMRIIQNINTENVVIKLSQPNRAGVFMNDGELGEGLEYVSILMPLLITR